jgi:hypothetical protein
MPLEDPCCLPADTALLSTFAFRIELLRRAWTRKIHRFRDGADGFRNSCSCFN